jgi:hypothetical protein
MRLSYTWIVIIVLLIPGCKKEKTTALIQEAIKEDYLVCAGDSWAQGYEFESFSKNVYFEYNNKVYVPQDLGGSAPGDQQVHIYDGSTWTTISSAVPARTVFNNVFFTIGNKGYMGRAPFPAGPTPFYEYNMTTNNWTRKADFPGEQEWGAAFFVINGKGYVVGGMKHDGSYTNKTWEYNPATNSWRERKNLTLVRAYARGFAVGDKGYIVHGKFPDDLGYYSILTEYNPTTNTWANRASYPGAARSSSIAFVIDGVPYVGGGTANLEHFTDFHKYNVSSNTWTRVDDIPFRYNYGNSFVIGSKGYVEYYVPDGEGAPRTDSMFKYFPARCAEVGNSFSGNNN